MKQKILLIDDDSILNFIHTKIISSSFPGIPIVIFKNGKEALEYIRNNPMILYLIFLDINMPVMNGWEFLKAISSIKHDNFKIHILTSSIDNFDLTKASECKKVISYLVKPLTKENLENLVFP